MKIGALGGKGYIGSVVLDKSNIDIYDIHNSDEFIENIDKYDLIIHMADSRLQDYDDNTINFFRNLNTNIEEKRKINSKIIYFSSCSVYGFGATFDENSNLNPTTKYAESKIISEKIFNNKPNIILRLGTVFGASPAFRTDLLINEIIIKAIQKTPIDIFSPDTFRPYLYLKDFKEIMSSIINSSDNFSGIINILNFNCSKFDIINQIKILNNNDIFTINKNIKETRNYYVSNKKSINMGLRYKYDLNSSITELYNYLNSIK